MIVDELTPCLYGFALLRFIHKIAALRAIYPAVRILLSKFDFKSAYLRVHFRAEESALRSCITTKDLGGIDLALVSLRTMLSLPTRLKNEAKILAKKQIMYIQKACAAGYEPSKKDVVARDANVKAANLFCSSSFRRLVWENSTFYMVPSTYVERRMVALCVMQAVQRQGGFFLEFSVSQQCCFVSPGAVERFVAGVLEQEARALGAARAVRATQSVRVPVKVAPTQTQGPPISILLQRYPVAPSRPVARSKKNKTFQKEIQLAPSPASSKSLWQRQRPPPPSRLHTAS